MDHDLSPAAIRTIKEAVAEAMRNGGPTPLPGTFRLPEDERLRALVADVVERKLAAFERTIEIIIDTRIKETCRQLGLRIDEDHIVETRDAIGGLFKMQKSLNRIAAVFGLTLASGMFFGLLKLLGLNIESFGGKP